MERLEQIDLDCIYRAVECDRKEKALQFFENLHSKSPKHTQREREKERDFAHARANSLSLTSGRIREEEEEDDDDDERRRRGS